jgi:hypothetical protein
MKKGNVSRNDTGHEKTFQMHLMMDWEMNHDSMYLFPMKFGNRILIQDQDVPEE